MNRPVLGTTLGAALALAACGPEPEGRVPLAEAVGEASASGVWPQASVEAPPPELACAADALSVAGVRLGDDRVPTIAALSGAFRVETDAANAARDIVYHREDARPAFALGHRLGRIRRITIFDRDLAPPCLQRLFDRDAPMWGQLVFEWFGAPPPGVGSLVAPQRGLELYLAPGYTTRDVIVSLVEPH